MNEEEKVNELYEEWVKYSGGYKPLTNWGVHIAKSILRWIIKTHDLVIKDNLNF